MAAFELERREMEESFGLFARGAWHVVEPERAYVHNWHIDVLADHLEALANRTIRNLIINVPPRHMKSILCSVLFPAWVWTWDPGQRFIYASYAQELAFDHSILTKRLVQSPWYRMRWGDKVKLRAGRKTMKRFETTAGGYRQATSVTGAGTGKGGDFVFADDPHLATEAASELARQEVINWWDGSMSTRGDNPATFCRCIIMQRVHEDDLTGHVTKEPGNGYVHCILPARYEGKKELTLGHRDPRTTHGEPLWKDRYDDAQLKVLELALGPYGAASQLQQRPAPAGGGLFKKEWFKVYGSRVMDAMMGKPSAMDRWIQVWDMKVKGAHQGKSYVVGEVWAQKGPNIFLVHQVRGKFDFVQTCNALVAMAEAYPWAIPIMVEDKANGPAVMNALDGVVVGLEGVEPRGDKEVRASAATPKIAEGCVWVPSEEIAPWMSAWWHEITTFPAGLDDQVDCLSMAVDQLLLQGAGPPIGWFGKIMKAPDFQVAPNPEQAAILLAREESRVRRQLSTERRLHPELFNAERDTTYTGSNYQPPWEPPEGNGG